MVGRYKKLPAAVRFTVGATLGLLFGLFINSLIGCGRVDLPHGPEGPEGPAGPKGEQGPAGADGKDGLDGQDGKDYTPDLKYLLYVDTVCNNIDVFQSEVDGIYFAAYSSRVFILGPAYQYIWKSSNNKYCQLRIIEDKIESKYKL